MRTQLRAALLPRRCTERIYSVIRLHPLPRIRLRLGSSSAQPGLFPTQCTWTLPSSWECHLEQENPPCILDFPAPLKSICLQDSKQLPASFFIFHPPQLEFPSCPSFESLSWADLLFILLASLFTFALPSQASSPHFSRSPTRSPAPTCPTPLGQAPVYLHKP